MCDPNNFHEDFFLPAAAQVCDAHFIAPLVPEHATVQATAAPGGVVEKVDLSSC